MLSSLRARLLLWYTLILALVIATFAGDALLSVLAVARGRHRPGTSGERRGAGGGPAARPRPAISTWSFPPNTDVPGATAPPPPTTRSGTVKASSIDRIDGRRSTFRSPPVPASVRAMDAGS